MKAKPHISFEEFMKNPSGARCGRCNEDVTQVEVKQWKGQSYWACPCGKKNFV